MKLIAGILAAAISAPQAYADVVGTTWAGQFRPVSKVCEGMSLRIDRSSFGLGRGCEKLPFRTLVNESSELTIETASRRGCSWSGWTFTLKRNDPTQMQSIDVSGFENGEAYRSGQPAFECAYLKR
jgi:hypothetical protein